jgi:EmrB/QacA subfamily drug resistance transporter
MTAPRGRSASGTPRRPAQSTAARASKGPAKKVRRSGVAKPATKGAPKNPIPLVPANPWNALWAMLVGFFMILVDSTIVAVANPTIMDKLQADYDAVIWVTSAYLLAYAVPLLVAGRLGDRFGPKNLYMIGLFIFTVASLWCGLSGSIEMLIAARVVQGIGAALLTPQTLSTITRIFPPERRGVAMSVWGATAGVATLVGPLAGGVLVDRLGWQWIFFVNVPIGILGLALAAWLIPVLPTTKQRFDVLGVLLSGVAMFLVVFGLQEGQSHNWSMKIWAIIIGGVVTMVLFVIWQAVNKREPLIPLRIFRDRDFSLANVGIAVIGFVVTAMILPLMFYAQAVCGLSPTRSALLTAPMAIATGVLAPVVGRIVDRSHPRPIIGFGFSTLAIALTWLSIEMTPTTPIWRLTLPLAAMGVGMAFIWAPLAATATRNLPPQLAGAGSGVYNATRQVGSVLGSAGMAAFMTSRISAEMPAGGQGRPVGEGSVTKLPAFLHEPFAAALSQSILLPAFVALFGVVAALFLVGFGKSPQSEPAVDAGAPGADPVNENPTDVIPAVRDDTSSDSPFRRPPEDEPAWFGEYADDRSPADGYGYDVAHDHPAHDHPAHDHPAHDEIGYDEIGYDEVGYHDLGYGGGYGYVDDDDGYVEFTVTREPEPEPHVDDGDTAPLATRVEHPRPAPAEAWHSAPVESWHSLLDDTHLGHDLDARLVDDLTPAPVAEPIGFAHNGFHVDEEQKFQPVPSPSAYVVEPLDRGVGRRHDFVDGFDRLAHSIDSLSDSVADLFERHRPFLSEASNHRGDNDPSRHRLSDESFTLEAESGNRSASRHHSAEADRPARHYRDDPDDAASYGRHSHPRRD